MRETASVTPARQAATPEVLSRSLPFPDDATQDRSGFLTYCNRDPFVPCMTFKVTAAGGQEKLAFCIRPGESNSQVKVPRGVISLTVASAAQTPPFVSEHIFARFACVVIPVALRDGRRPRLPREIRRCAPRDCVSAEGRPLRKSG